MAAVVVGSTARTNFEFNRSPVRKRRHRRTASAEQNECVVFIMAFPHVLRRDPWQIARLRPVLRLKLRSTASCPPVIVVDMLCSGGGVSFDTPWWGDSSWVYDGVVTSLTYDKDTRSLYVAGAFDRVNGEAPCQSIAVSVCAVRYTK